MKKLYRTKPEAWIKGMILAGITLTAVACIEEKDLYQEQKEKEGQDEWKPYVAYIYNYKDEVRNATVEITIRSNQSIDASKIKAEIPPLKYNKSWLLLFTQDDCKQTAFCNTWAAINGRPLFTYASTFTYDYAQLLAGDVPPSAYTVGKTLGSTDGTGREVRFVTGTTVAPEFSFMYANTEVRPGYKGDFHRFHRNDMLWDNVKPLANYGCGIAFHNLRTDESNMDKILEHYPIAQDSIVKHLGGRGAKMLSEPDGNLLYTTAAHLYAPIHTLTSAQHAEEIRPFQVNTDLDGIMIKRQFEDNPDLFKPIIEQQIALPKEARKAINIGVHSTDEKWVTFLQWVNDKYGKDGDDSVWFTSQEEYYEYNYYRMHADPKVTQVDDKTVKITLTLPSQEYFYFPSVSLNVQGVSQASVASVGSNDAVSGLTYGSYQNALTINIDCRKFLVQHATHYVELYEKDKSNAANKADAQYFVSMIKDSSAKTELLNRVK